LGSITVIGGGARSKYWGRILASALGRPLVYRDGGEVGPAYGAARLAQLGYGGGSIEKVCAAPPVLNVVEPDASLAENLSAKLPRFRALYRALKSSFQEIV